MGRPPILPKKKKDGFYIEVKNKGAKTGGVILIRDTYEAMMQAARMYERSKDVTILGEHRNGKRVEESKPKKTAVKAAAKPAKPAAKAAKKTTKGSKAKA